MPSFRKVLLAAVFTLLALYQPAAAAPAPEPTLITPDPGYFQVIAATCGEQNDLVEYHQENVTVTGSEWSGNNLVFYLQANEGYTFADGTTATISYTDPGNCAIQGSIPVPIQIEECGPVNDTFRQDGELPVGVDPAFTVSSDGAGLIVTYSPLSGYNFVTGPTYSFTFTDKNDLCVVEITAPLTPPTIVEACGADDTVTPAISQPEGVVVQPQISVDAATGVTTLTYSAAEGYVFADGYDNVIEHTDQGDNCPVLTIDIDDTTFQNLPTAGNLPITGSLVLDNVDLNNATNQQLSLDGTQVTFFDRLRDGSTWRYEWRAANSELRAMCTDGEFLVEASVDVEMYGSVKSYSIDPFSVPCSLGAESIVVIPTGEVNHIEICGNSDAQINDIITLVPQTGVEIESETWGNGEYLIYLEPAQGYIFPPGTETLVRIRDNATQCGPSAFNIDETSQALSNVQVGQEVTLSATLELPEGNPYDAANLTLRMAGTGEELHVSLTPTLGTGGVLPVEFTYVIPANFEDVCSRFSGQMPLELTAYLTGPTYSNPVGFTELMMDTAALPCSLADVVTPDVDLIVQTEVCGPNNDTFAFEQEGVEFSVGDWSENANTLTFTPADGFSFPEGATTTHAVTDENISCEEEPVGKHVTVQLNTSDGGSIEGTPYQVHAPVASMAQQGPLAEGVVNADNRIMLEGLLPGDYRLVLAPEGYDSIDTTLAVTDGEEPQEIIIDVAAVQIPETPTPSPTATVEPTPTSTAEPTAPSTPEPTGEPTVPVIPESTVEPTAEPTATEKTVSGLPETGSGTGGSPVVLGLAGLLTAMIALMAGSKRVGRR